MIEKKAQVVLDRMNHYMDRWDELMPAWVEKQYANSKKMDEIKFELPEIVDDAYFLKHLGHSPAHEMRAGYLELLRIADLCWEQHFEFFNLGLAGFVTFSELCKKLFPDITDTTIGKMCASGSTADTFLPEQKLGELARLAIDLGVADAIMADGNADEVEARLEKTEAGKKWQARRDSFRDPYFYVGTGYSVMMHDDKSWNDDWNLALAILRDFIQRIKSGTYREKDPAKIKQESDALVEKYRSFIKDPNDKAMFDRFIPIARRISEHAESHMFWGEGQYQPRQYQKLNQLAEYFCRYEMLDDPKDLYYLHRWEIPMLIQDLTNAWATRTKPAASWQWRPEIKWRKEVFKRFSDWDAPPFLGKTIETIHEPFTIALWGITSQSLKTYLEGADVKPEDMTELHGIQGSPGVAEGSARVLATHQEIDKLKEGEILVASLTSPSWGPAFTRIAACVTDIGGMMSHAAIVCREYNTPAVVGTGFGTKAIKTGDRIKVDGNEGVVTIVKRGGGV